MSAYLITRVNVTPLDTVVFSAGPKDNEEAVAVFTDPRNAEQYIEQAGWIDQYTVATLDPIPFLRWLLQAHDDGVRHIAIDPAYAEQMAGTRLNTLSIEGHLEHAGKHIIDVARPDF